MKNINIGIVGYEKKYAKFFNHAKNSKSIYKIKFIHKSNIDKKKFKRNLINELKVKYIKFLVICNNKFNNEIIEIINSLIKKNIVIVKASTNYEIENHGFIIQKYFKDFSFRDIFLRESLKINSKQIRKDIQNKKVLVTGGAGSIGSNLVINLLRFNPKKIYVIDNNEYSIFKLKQKILNNHVKIIEYKISDVTKLESINKYIYNTKPDIIFHTAALKHVTFLEKNPAEGIETNIFGTKNILDAAINNNVKKFIHISSDKAAEPKSILGITKFLSEIICVNANSKKTKIGIVRFGNVFDSTGSVSETFRNKILNNEKISITHKSAKRFFMSKDESSNLLFNVQHYLNKKKQIQLFTHDMGKAIKIKDLAKKMIFLSGRRPDNFILKKYSGLKEGEKLQEKLLNSFEDVIGKDDNNIIEFKSKKKFNSSIVLKQLVNLNKKNWTDNKKNKYLKNIKKKIFNR